MSTAWDAEKVAERTRTAYCYLVRIYPSDAPLEAPDGYQDAVLKVQATGNFDAYEDALRGMMRAALEIKTARKSAA